MLTFPNAKINLGLNITEKRPDGYHNLETIFYPIPVEDALEINPLSEGDGKYVIDADACLDCGTCEAECPNEAIHPGE